MASLEAAPVVNFLEAAIASAQESEQRKAIQETIQKLPEWRKTVRPKMLDSLSKSLATAVTNLAKTLADAFEKGSDLQEHMTTNYADTLVAGLKLFPEDPQSMSLVNRVRKGQVKAAKALTIEDLRRVVKPFPTTRLEDESCLDLPSIQEVEKVLSGCKTAVVAVHDQQLQFEPVVYWLWRFLLAELQDSCFFDTANDHILLSSFVVMFMEELHAVGKAFF